MKKVLFNTLCVSALLTACTDNELATMTPDNGQGEKIEVKIGAEYSDFIDEAGTRMTLVGNEWAWVNGDMLGACKVAAIEDDDAVKNVVSSNYPFVLTEELTEPVKTATFKTNTAVFAGKYAFYHQYNGDLIGATESKDDLFNVTFPAVQVVDPADAVAHVASENTWVSPVIKLGGIKYEAENETAIKFVSLNAILKLNITNNSTEGDLVINKVDVNGAQIPQKGNLDFATSATFSVLDASAQDYGTKLDAAIENMNKAATNLLATGATEAGTKISAIITGDGISVKKGAGTVVYVLIPAGAYDINSASVSKAIKNFTVYTNKGQFTITAENARRGSNKGQTTTGTAFNRNSLLNLYPVLEGKATAVEKYEINNKSDWNNAVAYALANTNQMIEFELKADIAVDELPTCPLYVTGTKKLVLNSEKSFTMVGGSYFETVWNNGTLNMKDNVYVGSLTNKGTMNVAATEKINGVATSAYTAWKGNKTNGVNTLSNQGTIVLNGQMNNGAGTWTNTAAVWNVSTLGTIQINDKASLVLGAVMTNSGKIVNNGTINVASFALTNEGTIEVATATGKFVGAQNEIVNNKTISLDAAKDVFVDANGKAVSNSFVAAASTGKVEVAIVPANVTTALPKIEEVSSVKMSGAWNQELLETLNTQWSGITAQTWDGVTFDVKDVNGEFEKIKELTVNGTSTIKNSGTDAVELGLEATAAAKVTINGDLTIAKNVTVGKEKTNAPAITVLGSVVNNGKIFAGLTVGAAPAYAGAPANTSAKFTNNEDATVDVVSAYSTSYTYVTLDLYGIFVNNDAATAVNVSKVDFKIKGESTYTGTYTVQP